MMGLEIAVEDEMFVGVRRTTAKVIMAMVAVGMEIEMEGRTSHIY